MRKNKPLHSEVQTGMNKTYIAKFFSDTLVIKIFSFIFSCLRVTYDRFGWLIFILFSDIETSMGRLMPKDKDFARNFTLFCRGIILLLILKVLLN